MRNVHLLPNALGLISERGTSNEQVENVIGIMSREGNVLGKGKGVKKFEESGRKKKWSVHQRVH